MISVVVPTRNNTEKLERCLQSLRKQSLKCAEIIVVDGRSTDGTLKTARKHKAKVITDTLLTIGNAYYAGAKTAKGDIVAFIDDDAFAPKNWLQKIKSEMEKEKLGVVGGEDLLPKNSTKFQQAVYQTDLAKKPTKPLYGKYAKNRLRAANIAFRAEILKKENFNRQLKGLQEPELLHRLLKQGCKMKFDPSLHVYHQRRNSLSGIFRQIYRNGKAKIVLIRLHKDTASIVDAIPVAYFIILLFSFYSAAAGNFMYMKSLIGATATYFLLKPAYILSKTRNLKYYPRLFGIVLTREIAYGLGILAGISSLFRSVR